MSINALFMHVIGIDRFTIVTTFIMILQLSGSGAFFSETLSNEFFVIGKGFPFYYGVRMFRTILFGGLENLMSMNWMVPTVWNVICFALSSWITIARLQRRILVDKLPIQALRKQ